MPSYYDQMTPDFWELYEEEYKEVYEYELHQTCTAA